MHAILPNYQYVNKRNLQWGLLGFIAVHDIRMARIISRFCLEGLNPY